MKKRDKFWIYRILWVIVAIIIFIGISLYNIVQFNASFIKDEIKEFDIFKRHVEWTINLILKNNDIETLQKYCNDFKNNKEFSIRVFDENKNVIASTTADIKSKISPEDARLKKVKYNLIELYKHSFKDRSLESASELNINNKKYFLEVTVSQDYMIKAIIDAQENIFIMFGVCLILLFICIIQIFFTIRSSFNSLEDSVVKISKGELDTKIKIPRNGLLEELATSVIYMTQRLKMQIDRLSKLEQYKTEFIQNLTHEIKTPITAINSSIELIEERNEISQIDKECLDIINFQTNSINKLVGDILALAETDLKKTEEIKNFKDVNLSEVIKEAIEYQGITDCKINLIGSNDIVIKANRELLIIAVSNLLSNAIKYAKSENIDIVLTKEDNVVTIEIKDYGIGIDKKHLSRIFERFYRVDTSRSRKKGGTGLGLSIVKNIVELHNWEIDIESEVNKGTSFKIVI